jgi:hypothetical protein
VRAWLAQLQRPSTSEAVGAVLSAVLVTRVLVCVVIFLSLVSLPARPGLWSVDPNNLVLTGLVRHNGWDFTGIARDGYGLPPAGHALPASVAFFPLYPLLVHLVSGLVGQIYWPAVLISNLTFLGACTVLYRLAKLEYGAPTAARAVFYLAAAPAAVYFSAAYAESLFLLFVTLTFYNAARRQWGWAALAGALAAATRNTGVLLVLVVALEGLHQQGVRWQPPSWRPATWLPHLRAQWPPAVRAWRSLVAAACVPAGLAAYMIFLGHSYGDPWGFIHAETTWNRDVSGGGFLHLLGQIQDRLQIGPHFLAGQVNPGTFLDALGTLAYLPLVVMALVKLRPAYGVFALLSYLVPLSTGTAGSMLRFTLLLLPCNLLLALWGRRPWVDRAVLGICLPLMAYVAIAYSHGYPPY